MSLFDAAVEQVVKDVGEENIVAVSDRNLADYCKIWMLAVRKQHTFHWPWKSKFEYVPTEVMLSDILTEPLTDVGSLASTSTIFENYQSTPSFKRSGKIGGKLASEFKIDASVSKTLQVLIKLGNITKKEILWEKLYDTIKSHEAKLDHPLVKMIKNNKHKKLFLIGMTILAGEEELNVSEETKEDVDGGASVTIEPSVGLKLDADASNDQKLHTQFKIPAGTCLAYSCDEITIDCNGAVTLELEEDVRK